MLLLVACGKQRPSHVLPPEQLEAILYDYMNAQAHVEAFMKNWENLPQILEKQGLKETDINWFLQHCGWNVR